MQMVHMSTFLCTSYMCPVTFPDLWKMSCHSCLVKCELMCIIRKTWTYLKKSWPSFTSKMFQLRCNTSRLFLWFSNFVRTFVCDHRKVEAKDGLDHRLQLLGDFLSPPLATTHPLVKFNNCKICVNLDLWDPQYWISWLQIPKSFREALFKVKCIGMLAIFPVTWTFGRMYFPDVLGVKYVEALVQQLLRKVKQNRVEGVIWKLA